MSINLDTVAEFTWNFGQEFLLEVNNGKHVEYYVWSDPDYNGDNTIKKYVGNPNDFTNEGFCGRDKGCHVIRNYCGDDVVFILE